MVNKVALGILAVIVLTAMAVGGLVGLQLSDDGSPAEATPTPAPASTPTPTPTPGTPVADGGEDEGGEATPTPTPSPTPTASPADYNETLIEVTVRESINDRREDREMRRLGSEDTIDRMALNHSRAMARVGYVTHDAAGFTTAERYEAFGLADRCRIPDNTNTGIREDRALETVDKKTIGRNYTFATEDRSVVLENETVVAQATVDTWFAMEETTRKLLLEDASIAGVGVVVTDRGGVYVTVDLC